MINGTKLLNVAGMTRGRRDGILKSEKIRHVVKIGPMHLKGVWYDSRCNCFLLLAFANASLGFHSRGHLTLPIRRKLRSSSTHSSYITLVVSYITRPIRTGQTPLWQQVSGVGWKATKQREHRRGRSRLLSTIIIRCITPQLLRT